MTFVVSSSHNQVVAADSPKVRSVTSPLLYILTFHIPSRQLKKAGCTTELASNGQQALEKVQALVASTSDRSDTSQRFDAILVSLHGRHTIIAYFDTDGL